MKPSFGFIFTIDLSMSFVVGAVMSFAMMIYNGQPLEPMPLLVNVVLATVIGLVVLLIIPVIRGGENLPSSMARKISARLPSACSSQS